MGFLNEFLLGDLPYAVQVGAVTAGRRRHISPTGLREKEMRGRNVQSTARVLSQVTPFAFLFIKQCRTSCFESVYRPQSDT